jgi:hypothetical protein
MTMCTRVPRTKEGMVDANGEKLEYGKDSVADDGCQYGVGEEKVSERKCTQLLFRLRLRRRSNPCRYICAPPPMNQSLAASKFVPGTSDSVDVKRLFCD